MGINKVQYGNTTLIDLTDTTAVASDVASGKYFYGKDGVKTLGTGAGGVGGVTQDQDGYIVLDDDAPSGSITVESLSVTSNGTYTAPSGKAYSPVSVNVSGGGGDTKSLIDRSITSITLPNDLTSIGNGAFYGCTNLALSSLPNTVTAIGDYAFRDCYQITLTSLPNGVTYIGEYAFSACSNLALSSLPSGITSISMRAFMSCVSITISSMPSGVTSISGYAFYNCYQLPSMNLSNVTSVGSNSFYGCRNMTSLNGNGAITSLSSSAFNGCSSLKTVSLPNMAVSSLSTVFGNSTASSACQALEFCDIGSSAGIASNAFANCYALETLVLRKTSSITTLSNVSAFTNTPMRGYGGKTGTVYVPEDLITSYQTATNWSTLYNDGTVEFKKIEGSNYEL